MKGKEFNVFKKKTIKFKVNDNHLFHQKSENLPIIYVVE